jgi:hypothetical protein
LNPGEKEISKKDSKISELTMLLDNELYEKEERDR